MLIVSLQRLISMRFWLRLSAKHRKTHLWALCFKINCSNHKKVLLCVTFCRTCTLAFQVFFAASLVHEGHCPVWTTRVSSKVCCKTVWARTSFWIVILSLIRREWGSVQMKDASMSRTFIKGRAIFLRQIAAQFHWVIDHCHDNRFTYQATLETPVERRPRYWVATKTFHTLDRSWA